MSSFFQVLFKDDIGWPIS